MSSEGPFWFCHECHSEMRPLMVPDPVCASCRGSFVEKMENPSDDPRHFAHDDVGFGDDMPPGVDAFLLSLQTLMDRGMRQNAQASTRSTTGPSMTFEVRGPNGRRTINLGGPNTLRGAQNGGPGARPDSPGGVPTMSAFLRSSPLRSPNPGDQDRPTIQGHLMAQYLMNLLSQQDLPPGFHGGGPENGRMGDYVFNQEALDQVITQIMEHSNAHRPVPATEEIMQNLPREVLMEGSKTLEHDCAVCKEQFVLETEDPDEQIVVTLPCNHPFHMPCILPWLKSSGTCPVCRHPLIPQPEHHSPPRTGPGPDFDGGGGPRRFYSGSGEGGSRGTEPGSFFQSIFSGFGNNNTSSNDRSGSGFSGSGRRSSSDPMSSSSSRRNRHSDGRRDRNLPGAWSEDLD
ncbi:hypothetical protein BYT27DRAFT_7190236 [Phlegmacium glaucopus]|nr:hypothetical protein BYT27DRAFT_7190236 [Phlegmacium glaucopus]